MASLGRTLNRDKIFLRNARQERFDFRGYSFGPHCFRQTGRWFIGASPSKKSVQRLKSLPRESGGEGERDPGAGQQENMRELRDTLNRLRRG
jgi:RNA-directed DNA polymerase